MKVYYDSGLWHEGPGTRGVKQKVNWHFTYEDMRCVIPVLYRFPKGIVFDILIFTDEAKLQGFFEQYPNEEALTVSQRQCAEQEHPLQPVPIHNIALNEKLAENGLSYSYTVSVSRMQREEEMVQVQKAYPALLQDIPSFACQRVCIDYPEADHRIEKLLRCLRLNRIRSMRLFTGATQWFYPLDIQFELPIGNTDTQIEFVNPSTKEVHRLYFNETRIQEFPFGLNTSRKLYTMLALYEIDPALPQGSAISFNSSISYAPHSHVDSIQAASSSESFELTGAMLKAADLEHCGKSPAAIGIIGGADGPTAIFTATKEEMKPDGPHGFPLHPCFSAPSLEKDEACTFIIEGVNVKHVDEKTYLLGRHHKKQNKTNRS